MADVDALSSFEFPKKIGLFTTFDDGDSFKIRVLTTDPVVTQKEFEGADGEINLSTKFAFIIYNFTLEKAQIYNASAGVAREIQKIHQDPDLSGGSIKSVDLKISATGNKLTRKYSINVLPRTETLTSEQIKECQAINLDEKVVDGQRMSFYKPPEEKSVEADTVVNEMPTEDINLDDIPF